MKVAMVPHAFDPRVEEQNIRRWLHKVRQHASAAGIEFVGPDTGSFDVLAVHAGVAHEYPIDVPVVAHVHKLHFTAGRGAAPWEVQENKSIVEALRHATTITVPGDWVAETLRRDMHLQPEILEPGVDWQEWQHGEPNEGYVLCNPSSADAACDSTPLVELARRFPQLRFVTICALPTPTPNIRAVSAATCEQMRKLVQRAGVYLATTKQADGTGILQSMAAGIPVLGLRRGSILGLVHHGVNGYLARPGEDDDLASGLEYCLRHRDLLGANGREIARQFTWQRVLEQLTGIYKATLERFSQPPWVSVVIPCYNYGHTLKRAVRSVLAQTHPPHEIVIVDNNSTDRTAQVGRELEAKHPSVSYTNCERQGVAHARNRGIERAVGQYIVCLDADDEIKPPFIEVCLQALRSDPSLGLAYTRMEQVGRDGLRATCDWPREYNYDHFLGRVNAVPTCCMFRRDLWQRLGGYRQRYAPRGAGAEDADFWMRMGALGYRGQLATQEPLFVYHLGGMVNGSVGIPEPDWRAGKPYVIDRQHPFASVATPAQASHPVRPYDEPVVSVVITCVPDQVPHDVTETLDSLEAQTFRQWEAILVCKGFSMPVDLLTAFPYVRPVQIDGSGAGAVREAGIAAARGVQLLFLDADDRLPPDTIQRLVQARQQEQIIVYRKWQRLHSSPGCPSSVASEQSHSFSRFVQKDPVEEYASQRPSTGSSQQEQKMGIITRGIPQEITIELAKLNDCEVFIETGTYYGGTTRWASQHFESVHTIERAVNLYNRYHNELSEIRGVFPHLGDSRRILPRILQEIGAQRSVFWLDGHWSGGDTAGEDAECPLLDELACLSNRFEDIILIDDARLFLCAPPLPYNPSQWPTIAEIIYALPASGRNHFVQIVDDVIFVIPDRDSLKNHLVDYAQKRSSAFWSEFSKCRV